MSETWLPFDVESATTSRYRARGLIGRTNLDQARALWISPCKQVHTIGMRFPIDVVFLGRRHEVVHIISEMKPWRISRLALRAIGALELPVGTLGSVGIRMGDALRWPSVD